MGSWGSPASRAGLKRPGELAAATAAAAAAGDIEMASTPVEGEKADGAAGTAEEFVVVGEPDFQFESSVECAAAFLMMELEEEIGRAHV